MDGAPAKSVFAAVTFPAKVSVPLGVVRVIFAPSSGPVTLRSRDPGPLTSVKSPAALKARIVSILVEFSPDGPRRSTLLALPSKLLASRLPFSEDTSAAVSNSSLPKRACGMSGLLLRALTSTISGVLPGLPIAIGPAVGDPTVSWTLSKAAQSPLPH